jgi:hypothetical protein
MIKRELKVSYGLGETLEAARQFLKIHHRTTGRSSSRLGSEKQRAPYWYRHAQAVLGWQSSFTIAKCLEYYLPSRGVAPEK